MQRLIIIAIPRSVAIIADISNRMSVSLNKYTSTSVIINAPTKIQNNIFYSSPNTILVGNALVLMLVIGFGNLNTHGSIGGIISFTHKA